MADVASSLDSLKRLNQLLDAGLNLPAEERAAWLNALPEHDQPFAPRLSALLQRASLPADDFLHRPLLLGAMPADASDAWADTPLQDQAGDTVGPYRLLREIGSGGMACVWLAERVDGALQRQVALKLPRWGVAPGLAQRMARERDILASLAHAHIARLYDAGLTPQGRPWLAMEVIEGAPIDEYCNEQKLNVRERVHLFLQVLDAVIHAHARLVVHRDLKPSNILVNPAGEVCLLDFGVAKLLADDGSPSAAQHQLLTQHLGGLLTPDYAAPEQAGGKAVGVAADVYALGLVLYELLAGRRPYELQAASSTGLSLEARIMQAEVPPASSQAAGAATVRALRGDIDAMLHKALQKDPAQRYGSAEAFAQDLRRHLQGEPVHAQAPSRSYRLRKFVGRHRWGLATTVAVGVSLAAGLGAALWQAHAARVEAQRAEQAKKFIASIFQQAQPHAGVGGPVQAMDLLNVAAQRIENELVNDAKTAAELGVMIGHSYSALGDPQRGETVLRAAVARAYAAFGPRHPITVHGRALLAESLSVQYPQEAASIAQALVPDALAGLPATAVDAVDALRSHSFQLAKQDLVQPSYDALLQAIEIGERHLGPSHEETLTAMGLLSNTYGRFGEPKKQLEVASVAMQRAEMALGRARPNNTLTAIERWYAEALRRNDRPRDALPILRRVVIDQRASDAAETARVRNALYQLGLALGEVGELPEAISLVQQVVALEAQHNIVDNEDRLNYSTSLATVLGFAARAEEALRLMDQLQPLRVKLGQDKGLQQRVIALRRARMLALAGRGGDAQAAAQQAAEMSEERLDLRIEAWTVMALNHRLQGRAKQALVQAQAAWAHPTRATMRPRVQAAVACELAAAALTLGQTSTAQDHVRTALKLYETAQVGVSPISATAWLVQARLDVAAGRMREAQQTLKTLAQMWTAVHPGSAWHAEATYWQALADEKLGDVASARAMKQLATHWLALQPLPALRPAASLSHHVR
jgi:eukaryotic-like serine/threonine-protein kinase